jgi:hypothetical protein
MNVAVAYSYHCNDRKVESTYIVHSPCYSSFRIICKRKGIYPPCLTICTFTIAIKQPNTGKHVRYH